MKIYPEPRPFRFPEWALQLMSPGATTVLLVISLVIVSVSLLVYVKMPEPKLPDPRIERKRALMGYDQNGAPIYDSPDPNAMSSIPVYGVAVGFLMSSAFGVLLLGQLVGLARKAAAGDCGNLAVAHRPAAKSPPHT